MQGEMGTVKHKHTLQIRIATECFPYISLSALHNCMQNYKTFYAS